MTLQLKNAYSTSAWSTMIYSFHQYELDASRYELRRDGEPVSILPKTFELLAYLLTRHGQMVSKEALYSHLWPEEFVSESALIYHVASARKAVGDSGRRQQLIKTVYGPRVHVHRPGSGA